MPTPQIVQGERATAALVRGFDRIAGLLAVTLGPTKGVILSQSELHSAPEVLSDAATIARRVIAVPGRAENVGAMLARSLAWRTKVRAGDGCAIAAVLAQAMIRHTYPLITAGADPMLMRRGIEGGVQAAIQALGVMARPVRSTAELTRVAETITGDLKLSAVLGEIFGKLGPEAHVTIEDYVAPYLEPQYYEGGRWNGRLVSPYLITEPPTRRAVISECHVALYAGDVTRADDVQPLLETVSKTDWHQVALVAKRISGDALVTLVLNHRQGRIKVLAAELMGDESKRLDDFQDLALLTDATVLSPDLGRTLREIEPGDLGASPLVQADGEELVVLGGEGNPEAIQKQRMIWKTHLQHLDMGDEELDRLRFRLARLSGQIAKVKIGANTESERAVLHLKAEKAIRALALALREGVVQGGGVAYLNCIPAVRALRTVGDEALGCKAVARALEEPFLRIVSNAGVAAPALCLAEAQRRGPKFGFNTLTGDIVDMESEGILDAAAALREALWTAASGAIMTLTTDTIVLKRNPEATAEP